MPPITAGIQVAEIQAILHAEPDSRQRAGDLARYEGFAANRAFMVEQDTVASLHTVVLMVIHRDPVGVKFGHLVRRAWMEQCGLALGRLLYQTKQFRRRSLVKSRPACKPSR